MPQRKVATNYFRTVLTLKLEIKTLETDLEVRRNERERLVKSSGPGKVKAIDYSEMRYKTERNDNILFNRLAELASEIPHLEKTLEEKKEEYAALKKEGAKVANVSKDMALKVFNLAVYEGMSNEEIAIELNRSTSRIIHIKGEINKACVSLAQK